MKTYLIRHQSGMTVVGSIQDGDSHDDAFKRWHTDHPGLKPISIMEIPRRLWTAPEIQIEAVTEYKLGKS